MRINMFSRNQQSAFAGRCIAVAGIAALALTIVEPPQAFARASGPVAKHAVAEQGSTDISARRRHRRVYRTDPAAGLAIMGAMIGTIGAIAAHHDYDDDYYYGPRYYYGPPPVYYAPHPYYYGPRYYRYYPY
jgi:hypothetical protein